MGNNDNDCPRCGCNDVILWGTPKVTHGRLYGADGPVEVFARRVSYHCNHCGHMFFHNEPWQPVEKDETSETRP